MIATAENNMTIKYFDTLQYVQKYKEIYKETKNDPEALASFQAKEMESAIETAVHYVEKNSKKKNKQLATKDDLKNDLLMLKTELKTDINNLRNELKTDISDLRDELKTDISNIKDDIGCLRTEFALFKHDTFRGMVWTGATVVASLASIFGGLLVTLLK